MSISETSNIDNGKLYYCYNGNIYYEFIAELLVFCPAPSHTIFAPCHSIYALCHTIFAQCHTIFAPCHTIFAPCHTIFAPCHTIFAPCHPIAKSFPPSVVALATAINPIQITVHFGPFMALWKEAPKRRPICNRYRLYTKYLIGIDSTPNI